MDCKPSGGRLELCYANGMLRRKGLGYGIGGKREYMLRVTLNDLELAKLSELAEAEGLNMSVFVRWKLGLSRPWDVARRDRDGDE